MSISSSVTISINLLCVLFVYFLEATVEQFWQEISGGDCMRVISVLAFRSQAVGL